MSRAVQFSSYGGPEALAVAEVPDPAPGPGQVRLAMRAAGVNPIDWKILRGRLASVHELDFPAGLGSDVAGVVDEVGEGVRELAPGDEVLGSSATPSFAEQPLAIAEKLTARPAGVPWEVAGSLAVVVGTAWETLRLLEVKAGETLLVHAASGGVGLCAVQLAVHRGARVIGLAGPDSQDLVRSFGATPVLYGEGWAERVREVAADGVDAVLDASGRGELADSVALAGGPERVLTIAAGDASEYGVRLHGGGGGQNTVRALEEVLPLIESGDFEFPIAGAFPLERAGEALAQSESGHPRGKLVIVP